MAKIRDAAKNPKINFVQTFKSEGQSGLEGLLFWLFLKSNVEAETLCDKSSVSNRQIAVATIRAIKTCTNNLRPDT